jgi:hypothetical protein
MKNLRIESAFVLAGLIISIIFIFYPSPFWMAAFLFIAQPMFIYAIVSSLIQIYRDLKSKKVI